MKKSFDTDGLDESSQQQNSLVSEKIARHAKGVAGDNLLEAVPNYIKTDNENVIEGKNNSWIILGRDRPSNRLSGYGGLGHTQAASIDLVVGRMGASPLAGAFVDPNFEIDAARIHISQKTDVDKNFKLANGKIGPSIAKSAITLKADGIRVIGREGIKIITGTDTKNSQGGVVDTTFGIDLIAGNAFDKDSDRVINIYPDKEQQEREFRRSKNGGLEPIPKGIRTAFAMDQLTVQVEKLSGILSAYLKSQMEFNSVLGTHFHISPFFGMPTTPSETASASAIQTNLNLMNDCIIGLQKFKANVTIFKNTHLRPHGEFYINSKYHSLN